MRLEKGCFDFVWSSCSLEHLGSLEAGARFVLDSLSLLKRGGIAVHTTEFNCSSNERTVEVGGCVIYRRRDLEELACRVRRVGCWMEAWDFDPGDSEADVIFDYPPYYTHGRHHTKLLIDDYVVTSAVMIIHSPG